MSADTEQVAEIVTTMHRFSWGIDRRDWVMYRSVFADEIDVDYTSYRPGSAARMAADDWVARAQRLFPGLDATQHILSNELVDVDGDRARYRAYVVAEHFLVNALGDASFALGGYYDDELRRGPDGWRISSKKLVVTWSRGNRHVLTLAAERVAAASG